MVTATTLTSKPIQRKPQKRCRSLTAVAPLLWWRPTAATFVVAMIFNRVNVVDLVSDLVGVDLDVDRVDVDLDVDFVDVDLNDVDLVDVDLDLYTRI